MTTIKAEYEFDVFISYSHKDEKWVRGELLPRIEQAGLKAFIDFRDFTPGAPSIKECERGVVECRKTLLILTPDYIKSEWCDLEIVMLQTLSPANRQLRFIPLLKVKCDKPLYIGALTHINFADGADQDLAWKQLLTALGAPPEPAKLQEPQRDDWFLAHPYPMPPDFTGRVAERKMLNDWLSGDNKHPLLSLRALGGFGKSALAWHWLMNDVEPANWKRVVWWSFYERDASFDSFLTKTLDYLSGGQIKPARATADDVKTLVDMLKQPGTLLVLDGFERELRAFSGLSAAYQGDDAGEKDSDRDCISPLAEAFLRNAATLPDIRSKILLTTRLWPRVVEARGGGLLPGCRDEELTQMQPADAVGYFRARGVRGTRVEIEQACEPYGYHPLSLCLLAGLVVRDSDQPGDIASAPLLDVSGDLVGRQTHGLKVAYDSLTPERQSLLSRIAAFRSPMDYEALKALVDTAEESSATLGVDLKDLVARGLLHHDTQTGRFDLHPIVRRYAYDRLAAPDRTATHTHLRDYFAAVPPKDDVTRLEDLSPVIELYHHTVRTGQYDEACDLFYDRLATPLFYQFGAYQLHIDLVRALFPDGEDHLPRLKKDSDQAWTLNALANVYSLSGQPGRAVVASQASNDVDEARGHMGGVAVGLANMADDQMKIGELRDAEASLRRSLEIGLEIKDEFSEAVVHLELARLLAYRGVYAESEMELTSAQEVFEGKEATQWQAIVMAYHAQRELLLGRSSPDSEKHTLESALTSARRALELAEETARTDSPVERDYVRAHWLLGAAHCCCEQFSESERHLNEALERCRGIILVELEADILIDLARLRRATGNPEEARRLAEEARLITERSGYVLQGADAHLELAKLALAADDKATALDHAKQAKDLSTCDGPPDYTYKAAYNEAMSLCKQLGDVHLTDLVRSLPAPGSSVSSANTRPHDARVFISHSSEDKVFVRRLVGDLDQHNLHVWLDERELKPGDSIVRGIEGGLKNTDYLVIVLSRISVESKWVNAELDAALMDQLSGGGTVVLPVVIDDCHIPSLLRPLVYADFRKSYATGMKSLLQTLDNETLSPLDEIRADRQAPTPDQSGQSDDGPRRLARLTLGELRRQINSCLDLKELADVWFDTFDGEMMDDIWPNRAKNDCVRFLIDQARRKKLFPQLLSNLCDISPGIGC